MSVLAESDSATRRASVMDWEAPPAGAWRGRTSAGRALVLSSVNDLPLPLREQMLAGQCRDHRYYAIVEQTLPEAFAYRYAVLEEEGSGAIALQPFFIVDQDITAGLPPGVKGVVASLRRPFPRALKLKIVMVGCAAGEGQLDVQAPWAIDALREALETYARKEVRASMILFKDYPAEYRPALSRLLTHGYRRAPSMPGAAVTFEDSTFDDYVQNRLSRIYRKGLRRKFRDSERFGALSVEVCTEVDAIAEELHRLYLQTHDRSELKFEELTPDYFRELGRRMPERVRFFLWRMEGRLVAFALCMVHDGVLYDLNVGMDYEVALQLHLYFITWRDIVAWALENGYRHYYTGPLNYDPKLHLRLQLAPLDLYARHLSPLINPIFGRALNWLQPARHDPVIAKFPNAAEL